MLYNMLPLSCLGVKFLWKYYPTNHVFQSSLRPYKQLQEIAKLSSGHSCFAQACSFLAFCFHIFPIAQGRKGTQRPPVTGPSDIIQAFAIEEGNCLPKWSPNSFGPISQKQITERAQVPVLGWGPPPSPSVTLLSCSLSPPAAGHSLELF